MRDRKWHSVTVSPGRATAILCHAFLVLCCCAIGTVDFLTVLHVITKDCFHTTAICLLIVRYYTEPGQVQSRHTPYYCLESR